MFRNHEESHLHSLQTLNMMYEYDAFMGSIKTMADLGCGAGKDIEWWSTRTTRDEYQKPLNINCVGIDILESVPLVRQLPNATYQQADFEGVVYPPHNEKFDVLWSHDSFQYCINPIQTLGRWRDITSEGAMLAIIVPQTTNIHRGHQYFTQHSGEYYHHTMVSLIHMLALNGWDCRAGFFLKEPSSPWLHAVVYKSEQEPRDPKTTTWYQLAESGLLPESAEKSIQAHGFLRQQDLVLPWLNHSLHWFGEQ